MALEPSAQRYHVLAIEDDPDILDIYEQAMEVAGHTLTTAVSGAQGIIVARANHPTIDVILLDVMLPGISGYEVCTTLRSCDNPLVRSIPIIFVSALSDVRARVVGLHAGGDDFMAKPFDLSELLARVEVALRRARMDAPATTTTEIETTHVETTVTTVTETTTDELPLPAEPAE